MQSWHKKKKKVEGEHLTAKSLLLWKPRVFTAIYSLEVKYLSTFLASPSPTLSLSGILPHSSSAYRHFSDLLPCFPFLQAWSGLSQWVVSRLPNGQVSVEWCSWWTHNGLENNKNQNQNPKLCVFLPVTPCPAISSKHPSRENLINSCSTQA